MTWEVMNYSTGDKLEDRRILNVIRPILTEREYTICCLRFGLLDGHQRTLEVIGKHFGVSRERVRQIEAKIMRKIRCSKNVAWQMVIDA